MQTPSKRPRPRSKKRRRLAVALVSVASVIALLIGGIAIYAASLASKFDSVETIPDVFPDEATRPEPVGSDVAGAQNILLLGSDTRGESGLSFDSAGGSRSDTMMVVHVTADRQDIQVMSIMRDSWVDIPGKGEAKVNAALAYGGIPLVVQTVEGLIDSRIDHVAIVNFEGFKGITNALGGVQVNNQIAFTTKGFSFAQGPVTLKGADALAFVRERYAFNDGDYQRVRNQQAFIKAVMDKTLSRETLTNPVTVSNLVGAVAPFMAVDEGLNSSYAAGLAFELRDIRSDDVNFFTMPTLGTDNVSGQSIVRVDFDQLEVIQGHFRADTLGAYEAKKQTMSGSESG